MVLPDVISVFCVKALGPLPRRVLLVLTRFFPRDIGLALVLTSSARENIPAGNFDRGSYFGAAIIR